MKTVRLYWLPICLLLSSLYLIVGTVDIKKDIEITKANITIDKAKLETREVGAFDVITAKQLLEAICFRYKLPIEVENVKNSLKLKVIDDDAAKKEVLVKYEDIMGFLTTVAALPYRMQFDSFSYGKDCQTPFEASLTIASNIY